MWHWKDNPHWMVRDGDEQPAHDPGEYDDNHACEGCGWIADGGVAESDVIYDAELDIWLCMGCD